MKDQLMFSIILLTKSLESKLAGSRETVSHKLVYLKGNKEECKSSVSDWRFTREGVGLTVTVTVTVQNSLNY